MDPKIEDKPSKAAENAARKMGEETRRATRMASEAGAGAVRASVELTECNAQTMQDVWQSGTKIASNLTELSMAQVGRVLGMGGDTAEQATEQVSRNMECILQSGIVLTDGMRNASRGWMEFAQRGMKHNLDRMEALTRSRSLQEYLAAHSDLVRHNLEEFIHSARRIAELSLRAAEEAARKVGGAPQIYPHV